jgi:hypothetical protein
MPQQQLLCRQLLHIQLCRPHNQLMHKACIPVAHDTTRPTQLSKRLPQTAASTLVFLLVLPVVLLVLLVVLLVLVLLLLLRPLLHCLRGHVHGRAEQWLMVVIQHGAGVHQGHHVLQSALW